MSALQPPGPMPYIDNTTYPPDNDHYSRGRNGRKIALLVVHATEGVSSGAWLSQTSPGGESIHHLYARDGRRYDIVKRQDTAYHTGAATWRAFTGSEAGVAVCNWISIGHELESLASSKGPNNGYTPAQVAALAYTLACELVSYGLDWSCVVRHADIAIPAGRKTDPAWFDWAALKAQVDAWVQFLRSVPPGQLSKWCL